MAEDPSDEEVILSPETNYQIDWQQCQVPDKIPSHLCCVKAVKANIVKHLNQGEMTSKGAVVIVFAAIALLGPGCALRELRWESFRPPRGVAPRTYVLETTGYCPCRSCCGWERNWLGRPVVAAGPREGSRKAVGVTASGTRAVHGTIAADTTLFPFGTIMYIPGYGYGRVEDRGSDIRGYHIDLFFRGHRDAQAWGRVKKKVTVWRASGRR